MSRKNRKFDRLQIPSFKFNMFGSKSASSSPIDGHHNSMKISDRKLSFKYSIDSGRGSLCDFDRLHHSPPVTITDDCVTSPGTFSASHRHHSSSQAFDFIDYCIPESPALDGFDDQADTPQWCRRLKQELQSPECNIERIRSISKLQPLPAMNGLRRQVWICCLRSLPTPTTQDTGPELWNETLEPIFNDDRERTAIIKSVYHYFVKSVNYDLMHQLVLYYEPELLNRVHSLNASNMLKQWNKSFFMDQLEKVECARQIWDVCFQRSDPQFICFIGLTILLNAFKLEIQVGNTNWASFPYAMIKVTADVEDLLLMADQYYNETPKAFYYSKVGLVLPIHWSEVMRRRTRYFLIDCRTSEEYNTSHSDQAFHLDSKLCISKPKHFSSALNTLLTVRKYAQEIRSSEFAERICMFGHVHTDLNLIASHLLRKSIKFVSTIVDSTQSMPIEIPLFSYRFKTYTDRPLLESSELLIDICNRIWLLRERQAPDVHQLSDLLQITSKTDNPELLSFHFKQATFTFAIDHPEDLVKTIKMELLRPFSCPQSSELFSCQ